ncbi:aromatic-ring-hydroxylating dioxygenase subunit beta [soil metagenome]
MNDRMSTLSIEQRLELASFYEDYAETVDVLDLVAWTHYFTEDALYRVIARESYAQNLDHATIYCDGMAMLKDRATMIDRVAIFEPRTIRHFISGLKVRDATDGVIKATANFLVIESIFDGEPQILMVGQYVDEIVRVGGELKFRKRDAVYDQYRIRTTLVFPV